MLKRLDLFNNPHLGVFLHLSERLVFHPPGLTKKEIAALAETLEVEPVELTLGGGRVLGCNIVGNDRGLLVSDQANSGERAILKRATEQAGMNLTFFKGRHNAVGNNMLASDKAALVSPRLAPSTLKTVEQALGVQARRAPLAGVENVGMAGVATAKGLLVHAKAGPEELEALEELFGCKPQRATVNFGLPLVGAGLAANSKGAVCGLTTTGIELGRIEEGLSLF